MKKIFPLMMACIAMLFAYNGNAQTVVFSSDLESWAGNVPNGFVGVKTTLEADSISPYTTSVHGGTYACKLVNTESSHKRFTTQSLSLVTGTVYYVSYWVRGHGSIRLGLYDGRPTGSGYATYLDYHLINSNTWAKITDSITCENTTSSGEFILSTQYTFADIDHLQIDDVSITDGPPSTNPLISITYPAANDTFYSASVDVQFGVLNFAVATAGNGDGHVHAILDGGSPSMLYTTAPFQLTSLTAGTHELILQLVDDSHQPLTPNVADTVSFFIDLSNPNPVTIYDIQYTTDTTGNSPWMDSLVTTSGIVTAAASAGYFIQDGDGAWNGIYVYDNLHNPAIGDDITITGNVYEYYTYTEINNVQGFTINSSGNTLPAKTNVTAAEEKTEQYEGVLVKIWDAVCTALPNTYGEWQVYDGDTCNIDDMMYHFVPSLTVHYNVTGPVYFAFGHSFIEPRDANDVEIFSGIEEVNALEAKVFPNPAQEVIYFSNVAGEGNISVLNIVGESTLNTSYNGYDASIDISKLPSGVYIIKFESNEGMVSSGRFVKN